MKKSNRTKLTAILITIALLCTLLAGCNSGGEESSRTGPDTQSGEVSDTAGDESAEKPTLTVLCDFANHNPGGYINEVIRTIPEMTGYELKMEYVPTKEPDRANFITRAGVELMAGKGADVFVVDSFMGHFINTSDGCMFPYPEKAMKNKLFLPLDSYIENAEFTDFDRLMPNVLEAGKNEEGQQILPLTYNITAISALKGTHGLPDPLPDTRDGMMDSGNDLLKYMASPWNDNLLMYLGDSADILGEELNFTEDELLDLAMRYHEQTLVTGIDWEGVNVNPGRVLQHDLFPSAETEVTIIPGFNKNGGVTAGISVYGAVNRNTDKPDIAFAVLDKLLSQKTQQGNEMYFMFTGMPMDMELGNSDNRFMWGPWYMNDWNYEQYTNIRDRIDSVRFYTPLDREAENTLVPACRDEGATEDSIRKAVHSCYTTMQMMLAES